MDAFRGPTAKGRREGKGNEKEGKGREGGKGKEGGARKEGREREFGPPTFQMLPPSMHKLDWSKI